MCSAPQSCSTLCDPMDCSPPGPPVHDFPGKNTGVGCHFPLQGIFLTQGSNLVSPELVGRFFTAEPSGLSIYEPYMIENSKFVFEMND